MHRPSHTAVQIRREVRLAADSASNAGPEEEANWLGLSGNHLLFPHFEPCSDIGRGRFELYQSACLSRYNVVS